MTYNELTEVLTECLIHSWIAPANVMPRLLAG